MIKNEGLKISRYVPHHQLDFNIKDGPHSNNFFDKSNLDQINYLLIHLTKYFLLPQLQF
jgi:hypothetical protein